MTTTAALGPRKTPFHRWLFRPARFRVLVSIFPPLLGAGVHVSRIADDWTSGTVALRVHPWTANLHGAAFGGALFSATDILYGMMLAAQLGRRFEVWTKSAHIEFHAPGRGRLHLDVTLSPRRPRRSAGTPNATGRRTSSTASRSSTPMGPPSPKRHTRCGFASARIDVTPDASDAWVGACVQMREFAWRDGQVIRWDRFGTGPAVVFCHGTPWSSELWRRSRPPSPRDTRCTCGTCRGTADRPRPTVRTCPWRCRVRLSPT